MNVHVEARPRVGTAAMSVALSRATLTGQPTTFAGNMCRRSPPFR